MIWRKKFFNVAGAVALGCLVASSAQAIPITTSGTWVDPVAPPAVLATVTGEGTNQIGWGNPIGDGDQSSYEFIGLNMFDVNVAAILAGQFFPLGDFVHHNFPITEFDFDGVDLNVSVSVPALGVNPVFGPFFFDHLETLNVAPCDPDNGSAPCPDVVTVPAAGGEIPFMFMGQQWFFRVEGFRDPLDPNTIIPEFVTTEGQTNTARLFARVRPIPEPTTLLLLGLGLVGLGIVSRRRMMKK